jgi:hypothetical protein
VPFPIKRRDAMPSFEGTWTIQEHRVRGNPIIVKDGASTQISIYIVMLNYHVKIPRLAGKSLEFEVPLIDHPLSHKSIEPPSSYGVRLVFDDAFNPTKIVAGPLGSVIERWLIHPSKQPEDMGTITGTRG